MDKRPFDVIICDDTKPMKKSLPLTSEERRREQNSVTRLRSKFFGDKNFAESEENLRIAV